MGYIRHHAIVVVSYNDALIEAAHAQANDVGCEVTEIVGPTVNGFRSFMIAPDGSKEGWGDSHDGDARRNAWVEWANKQRYEDGSSSLTWSEIVVGDDDGDSHVVRHTYQPAEETHEDERKRIMRRLVELDALTARDHDETEIELDQMRGAPTGRPRAGSGA
jgi:hypothetical protein